MESWIPLMDIFMNSHSPETEAFLFLQSSFNSNPTSISTASFLSLLIKPTQTLITNSPTNQSLDSEEEKFEDSFGEVPKWLKDVASNNDSVLPWLPISVNELNVRIPYVGFQEDDDYDDETMLKVDDVIESNMVNMEIEPVDSETEETAASLKTRILNMESSLETEELVDDIKKLCVRNSKLHSLTVLNLIEPWNADDEIVPVLLSRLLDEKDDFIYTSNILCTVLLPKLLHLEKPASRVLLSAVIPYCKVHHKAAVRALLFPLLLHKEGINSPMCDVITKIVKECLHPVHVSSFCQKLLSQKEVDKSEYVFPPCFQDLVSEEVGWSESLFNLFQNVLNHNVNLTRDSVDRLVFHVEESAVGLGKSLKFANFLLCFVTKCGPLLKVHKMALSEAVGNTSSFLTKTILSKLASI